MADGMFGAPIGISHRLKDSSQNALGGMKILETAGDMSLLPAKQEGLLASAELHRQQAEKAKQEIEEQKKLAAALSQMGTGGEPTDDPAALLDRIGLTALKSGAVTKGREMLNTASQLRSRTAAAEGNLARAERFYRQIQTEDTKRVGSMVGTAKDQGSYESMLLQLGSEGIDIRQFPQGYEEAKPLLKALSDASVTEYQRRRLAQHDANTKIADRNSRRAGEAQVSLENFRGVQAELARERIRRLRRTGGVTGAVAAPTYRDQEAVKLLLKENGVKLDDEGTNLATYAIAARARELVKRNPGLNMDQATRQAFAEEKNSGSFLEADGFLDRTLGKKKFVGGGKTPGTALPLPMKDNKVDMSRLSSGRFYHTPDGKLWQRKGDKMLSITGGIQGVLDSKDDEDDDE